MLFGLIGKFSRQVGLLTHHRGIVDENHHREEEDQPDDRSAETQEESEKDEQASYVERMAHHAVDSGAGNLTILPEIAGAPDPDRHAAEDRHPYNHKQRVGLEVQEVHWRKITPEHVSDCRNYKKSGE